MATNNKNFVIKNGLEVTNGKIGVGTDNPQGSLHIKRQDTPQGGGSSEIHTDFILENPGTGNARFFLKTNTNNRNWEFFADDNDGAFGIYDGIADARRFTILPSGNIGIGANNPSDKLHVVGDIRVEDSDPTIKLIDSDGTLQSSQIHQQQGNLYFDLRNNTADGNLIVRGMGGGSATEKLRLTSNGQVAIGTDLTGGATDSKLSVEGVTALTNLDQTLMVRDSNNDDAVGRGGNIGFGAYVGGTMRTLAAIGGVKEDAGTTFDGNLVLYTRRTGQADLDERLRITSDGKVRVPDGGKFTAGNGDDLQIYHNGSANIVQSFNGTISLQVPQGSEIHLAQGGSFEHGVKFIAGGPVQLYHDGSKKLQTTSTGVTVTGTALATALSTGAAGTGINISTNTISGPATLTIDPAAIGDDTGLVVIKGDFQVDGTTTTINSTTLTVDDKNIVLASGAANSAAADGAGITIDGASATLTYNSTPDGWSFNKKVGINESNPGTDLHVVGDSLFLSSTGNGTLNIVSANNVTNAGNKIAFFGANRFDTDEEMAYIQPLLTGNSGGAGNVQTGHLTFGTSGAERVRITAGGNVGIGTDDPQNKLHVKGPIQLDGTSAALNNNFSKIYQNSSSTIDYGLQLRHYQGDTGDVDASITIGGNGSTREDNIVFFRSNGSGASTETMRIDENGNVGIGTNNPGTTLVLSSDDPRLTITDTDEPTRSTQLRNTAGNTYLSNLTSGHIIFGAPTEMMRIQDNGRVGIGTQSPLYDLDVSKTVDNGNVIIRAANNSETGNVQSILQLKVGNATVKYANFNVNYSASYLHMSGVNLLTLYNSFDTQIFRTNAGVEKVRFTSTGNVGIGTSNPGQLLSIRSSDAAMRISTERDGSTYNNSAIIFDSPRNNTTDGNTHSGRGLISCLGSSTSTAGIVWLEAASASLTSQETDADLKANQCGIRLASDGSFEHWASNNARFVIDNNGNVGVGTVNPDSKLQVTTANTTYLKLTSTTNGDRLVVDQYGQLGLDTAEANITARLHITTASDYGILVKDAFGDTVFTADDGNSRVGVGTDSPTGLFEVEGNNVADPVHITRGGTVTSNQVGIKFKATTTRYFGMSGGDPYWHSSNNLSLGENLFQVVKDNPLTSSDNLDSLTDGYYTWTSSNPTNYPGKSYMSMLQLSDNNQKIQMAFGSSQSGRFYVRRADSGTFYTWTEFARINETSNFTTTPQINGNDILSTATGLSTNPSGPIYWSSNSLTTFDPPGGGTGTDTATDVVLGLASGNRIAGWYNGYIRTLLEWNDSSDITIGQGGTTLIAGINLLPGSTGLAKVNGEEILTKNSVGEVNNIVHTSDGEHDITLFGAKGGAAQSGNFSSKLVLKGGGNQTRTLELFQDYSGNATINTSYSSNYLDFTGFNRLRLNQQLDMNGNNIIEVEDIGLRHRIFHDGDTNTYIEFHAADQWRVVTNNIERLEVNNSQTTINQAATVNGTITIGGTDVSNGEGGQINLSYSPNTTLTGSNLILDLQTNVFRIFADGSPNKGAFINLSNCADAVGSRILTTSDEGSGNGLDADTVDGQHGSYYTGYTDTAIANLVDSAPGTLDTLNELAAALGDDANFSTTITASIAAKLPLAGGQMSGDIDLNGNDIIEVEDITLRDRIKHDGDTNTFIQFNAADSWRVVTGNTERLEVNNTNVTVHQANLLFDSETLTDWLYITRDGSTTNEYTRFSQGDGTLEVQFKNDEASGAINFNFENTDTEANGGVNANTGKITLHCNSTDGPTIRIADNIVLSASRTYAGNTTNYFTAQPTGDFGSVQINGSGKGNWEGYSIDGRAVFMHDGSATMGLYDDVNNNWVLRHVMGSSSYTELRAGNNATIASILATGMTLERSITLLPNGGGDATSSTTTKDSEELVFMGKHWNGSASVDNYFSMSYHVESTTPTGKVYFGFGLDNNASSVATLSSDGTWDFQGHNLTEVEDIYLRDRIYHDGDTNTYIQFHATDQWRVVTGGTEKLEVNNSQTTINQNATVNGAITIGGTAVSTTEGGEIRLTKPTNQTTGDTIIDLNSANLRFFHSTSPNKGAYINLSNCVDAVGSRILTTSDEGSGNGLDADLLDGQQGSFYQSATNLTSGTINDARIPDIITPVTRVSTKEVRTSNGTELILNAGEAAGKFASQTSEKIYLNAEGGTRVSTPEGGGNFESGYVSRYTEITGKGIYFRAQDGTTRIGEITSTDTSYLRINQETDKDIFTPRTFIAEGGFLVPYQFALNGLDSSGNFIGGTIAGASDYGTLLRSDANDNVTAHTEWQDNYEIRLGNGADFRMDFNGADTVFRNYAHANGDIIFQGENSAGSNQTILIMKTDGTRTYNILYENNAERFRTNSTGVEVTGIMESTSSVTLGGELNLIGTSDANKYIDCRVGTNALSIRKTTGGDAGHENMARFIGDGGVELYHNNVKKFETTSGGVSVTGVMDSTTITSGTITLDAGGKLNNNTDDSYDKLRVWNSSAYAIGMKSGCTHGDLNDYAMTFSMNSDADRGWLWRDSAHGASGGAMSLSTRGSLAVSRGINTGGGETDTGWTDYPLHVDNSWQTGQNNSYISAYIDADWSGAASHTVDGVTNTGFSANRSQVGLRVDVDNSKTNTTSVNGNRHTVTGISSTSDSTQYTHDNRGLYAFSKSSGAGNGVGTQSVFGAYTYAQGYLSSGAANIYGLHSLAYRGGSTSGGTMYAVYGRAQNTTNGSGKSGNAVGGYFEVECDEDTIGDAKGVQSHIDHDGGTITTGYLFYGSYNGTIGTKWGIYINSETQNYFSGNVGIGATEPVAKLDVNGNIHCTKLAAGTASNPGTNVDICLGADNDTGFSCPSDGNLKFWCNNNEVASWTNSTLTFQKNATFNDRVSIRGHLDLSDGENLDFGSSDDVRINYNSNNWLYTNFRTGNGIVYQDNGVDKIILEDSGIIRPSVTNTGTIGTSSRYWDNGYFQDFNVSGTINVRGAVDLADNDILRLGSGDDAELFCNGSHLYLDLNSGIGNFYIRDGTTTRYTFNDNGSFTATGNVTAYSDIKLKDNIETISNPLDKVNQINGVTFDRIDTPELGRQMGVIAQDVEKVCPELVSTDDEGTKSVAYGNMVGLLIEAIKDQQKQIDELRAQLENKS